jgi:hypothetical protein
MGIGGVAYILAFMMFRLLTGAYELSGPFAKHRQ